MARGGGGGGLFWHYMTALLSIPICCVNQHNKLCSIFEEVTSVPNVISIIAADINLLVNCRRMHLLTVNRLAILQCECPSRGLWYSAVCMVLSPPGRARTL